LSNFTIYLKFFPHLFYLTIISVYDKYTYIIFCFECEDNLISRCCSTRTLLGILIRVICTDDRFLPALLWCVNAYMCDKICIGTARRSHGVVITYRILCTYRSSSLRVACSLTNVFSAFIHYAPPLPRAAYSKKYFLNTHFFQRPTPLIQNYVGNSNLN